MQNVEYIEKVFDIELDYELVKENGRIAYFFILAKDENIKQTFTFILELARDIEQTPIEEVKVELKLSISRALLSIQESRLLLDKALAKLREMEELTKKKLI